MLRPTPDQALFQEAEKKYQEKAYDEASRLYQNLLDQFPDSGSAPMAVLKMGLICSVQGDFSEAERFFDQVIKNYPGTTYARDAGLEMLNALYLEGKYQEVTVFAGGLPYDELGPEQAVRLDMIMGDSYLALKSPLEAYHAFLKAFQKAEPKEQDSILSRLKTAIALMSPPDLQKELEGLNHQWPAGYLVYQQALNFYNEGRIEEAVAAFTAFTDQFSDHEYIEKARQMLAEIESMDLFAPKTIGCLLPLSGKYQVFGEQALQGIELALSRFEKKNPGDTMRILIRDTASDPKRAQAAVEDLANHRVAAIIGPLATSAEAAVTAQSLKLPIITLTQKPHVTDIGDYVFRNFLTPEMQMKALVNYATDELHLRRFAILYPEETYGETFMNLFWDEVIRSGGEVVGVEAYDPTLTDFADPIKKLVGLYYDIPDDLVDEEARRVFSQSSLTPLGPNMSSDSVFSFKSQGEDGLAAEMETVWPDETAQEPEAEKQEQEPVQPIIDFDAIFIPDSADKAGLILPQLAYHDIKDVHLLGTNLWYSNKLIQMAKSHAEGAILPEGFFDLCKDERVSGFVRDFEKMYGSSPGFIEAVSFDTAMILFNLLSQPDVRYRTVLRSQLLTMPVFEGVTGRTCFDANGEAVKEIYLLRISGGRFEQLDYTALPIPETEP